MNNYDSKSKNKMRFLPFSLASEWLLFTKLSQLEFFGAEIPVDAGRLRRNPKRVLRYGAPADSFFGGDSRGVDRPVFSSSNNSTEIWIEMFTLSMTQERGALQMQWRTHPNFHYYHRYSMRCQFLKYFHWSNLNPVCCYL